MICCACFGAAPWRAHEAPRECRLLRVAIEGEAEDIAIAIEPMEIFRGADAQPPRRVAVHRALQLLGQPRHKPFWPTLLGLSEALLPANGAERHEALGPKVRLARPQRGAQGRGDYFELRQRCHAAFRAFEAAKRALERPHGRLKKASSARRTFGSFTNSHLEGIY